MTTQQDADLIRELRTLADRFSEGWHDGIKIDASDVMALTNAAARLEELTQRGEVVDTVSEFERGRRAGITEVHDAIAKQKAEQPAPLALSEEDAELWEDWIDAVRALPKLTPTYRAILAVDKLLRQRVQRLTEEQIGKLHSKAPLGLFCNRDEFKQIARAVEAALGIGEGAK